MTERVDFYVLKSAAAPQRWAFACRLTEKAYLRDLRVVILNDSAADARALDDLLWTFNDRSFIPHQLCMNEQAPDPATKVYLTALPAAAPAADLLVNLTDRLPERWERFARIAEIVKRHFESNVEATAVGRRLAFVLLRLGDAGGVEHIDEPRLAREPEGTGERLGLEPGHGEIDPPLHRLLLDRSKASRMTWQRRQSVRQQPCEICPP